MRLADGRGWVFVTHDKHGVLCDRITPSSNKIEEILNAVLIYKKRGDNVRTFEGEKAKSMQMLRNQAESNDATTLAGAEVATGIPTGALSAVKHDANAEEKNKRRRVLNLLAEQEATAMLASQSLRAMLLRAAAPRATFQNHPKAS